MVLHADQQNAIEAIDRGPGLGRPRYRPTLTLLGRALQLVAFCGRKK